MNIWGRRWCNSLSAAGKAVLVDKVMRSADTLCMHLKFLSILEHVLKLDKKYDKRAPQVETSSPEIMAKTRKSWSHEAELCRVTTKYDATNFKSFCLHQFTHYQRPVGQRDD